MMLTKPICFLLFLFLCFPSFAQKVQQLKRKTTPTEKTAQVCYKDVVVPATYKTITEQILVKEAATRLELIPAVLESEQINIMVKEGGEFGPKKWEQVPTLVLVREAYSTMDISPATYTTQTEQVLVREPSDGEEAVFKTIKKQVVTSPATTRERVYPAEYQNIPRKIAVEFNGSGSVTPEYQTIFIRRVKSPATTRETPIPPEYEVLETEIIVNPSRVERVSYPCSEDKRVQPKDQEVKKKQTSKSKKIPLRSRKE